MSGRTRQLLAVLFACLLAGSVVAPVAAAPDERTAGDPSPTLDQRAIAATDSAADGADESGTVDSQLRSESGETEVILRLDERDPAALQGDRAAVVGALQAHADRTQGPVVDRLGAMTGVSVEETWWITNAVMVTADLDRIAPEDLAAIDGVERVHAHQRFAVPEPAEATGSDAAENVTYGLEQINATAVWDEFNATGDDVRVAVADTGVDDDHPDIDLADQDGWIDLAGNASEPVDNHGHGTHVSGTISGGNASGTAIGVAPDVDLGVARVCLTSACNGSAILNSFEWAVQTDSDVLSMSLGTPLTGDYIDPVRNAMESGTLVVASIGNSGEGTAGSPGAVYDSIASGATNESLGVAPFSGGMVIDSDAVFGDAAPDDWPEEYVTPDIAAPGVDVLSSNAFGGSMCGDVEYCEVSGTSMSAPHKSGAAALIMGAANGSLDPSEVKDVMMDTAWKPDDWDEDDAQAVIDGVDTRYGDGIIDVHTATAFATTDAGIEGTVTDANGTPIEGATVRVDGESRATTDENGSYRITQVPGTYNVSVDAFGYESATQTVTIADDEDVVTADFTLADALAVDLADGQADRIESGESVSVDFDVANVESMTVGLDGDYDAANATLRIDGTDADFGETITFDEPKTGDLTATVETDENATGNFSLEHAFAGLGEEATVETGPTVVLAELVGVGVVDDLGLHGADVAETLREELPLAYEVDVVTSAVDPADYETFVVQHIEMANAEAFVDATDDGDTGVVYLDQWGSESNGVPAHSNATGDPAETLQDDFGAVPVVYELGSDHEIFDGVGEPGEQVPIHDGQFADLSWFEGTDFDVHAQIGDGDGLHGDAFAIDEESATILGSGLGYTIFTGDQEYTDDADAILANSVRYLATDEPEEPAATISLEDVSVQPGGTADVDLTVDTAIAGYETKIEFDPDVVQVTDVDGVDVADPIAEIDNENGTLSLAQAQADDVESPTLASIEFEHVGAAGDETDLSFDENATSVNDADGHLPVETNGGSITAIPCDPGDVNADGEITPYDATLTQQYIVGQEPTDDFHEPCADMNDDDVITPADVSLILEAIVDEHGMSALAG